MALSYVVVLEDATYVTLKWHMQVVTPTNGRDYAMNYSALVTPIWDDCLVFSLGPLQSGGIVRQNRGLWGLVVHLAIVRWALRFTGGQDTRIRLACRWHET